MSKINAQGQQITLFKNENDDYISLTDIAKYKDSENPRFLIQKLVTFEKYHRVFRSLGRYKQF